jgi:hypothetical protein
LTIRRRGQNRSKICGPRKAASSPGRHFRCAPLAQMNKRSSSRTPAFSSSSTRIGRIVCQGGGGRVGSSKPMATRMPGLASADSGGPP